MNKNYLKIKNSLPALPNPNFEPLVQIISNREITVDGCVGIVEYTDTFLSINCKYYTLNIYGFNFCIKSNTKGSIAISGCITDIKFITDWGFYEYYTFVKIH